MIVTETNLAGCFIIEPIVFNDERGSFFESFNKIEFKEKTGLEVEFVKDNQSISHKGVLRGLHFQENEFAQAKLVRVVKGKVLDVVVDLRKESQTFGKSFSIILSGENNKQLFVPRGFAHGFYVLENETIFNYKCDNYYHKEVEKGIRYNDSDLAIDWSLKDEKVILLEKDRQLMTFKQFCQ
ncbi:MAG: dTDP-4-dehydrorhamnose 3,5-epimerase [Polaribacter sp. SA4-10]|nr:MAG: dTDP-4-dehydrorhamnose 3,5-epimerase [Polaribacter sp. SA4-10]